MGLLCVPAVAQVHADLSFSSSGVEWIPRDRHDSIVLTVSGGGYWKETIFDSGAHPYFEPYDNEGALLPDGDYNWEMRFIPRPLDLNPEDFENARVRSDSVREARFPEPVVQWGNIKIIGGAIVVPGTEAEEGEARGVGAPPGSRGPGLPGNGGPGDPQTRDQVILDDLIVDGSACIGFDCVNGESFGFDTIRLKENNLRIKFDDTSTASSYPRNDWQLTANDSANGGANKFSIDDISGSRTPFTVEANARSHSLYVDDGGRIGIRTSTPSVEIHVIDGDTPTLRLQQDGSSGFAPQTWDVAGNETNFFVRDVTNGSTLPFRIRPAAPSSSIFIDVDGDVGLSTTSPDAALHVRRTDGTAQIKVEDTSADNQQMLLLEKTTNAPFMRFTSQFGDWDFVAGNSFIISDPTTGVNEFLLTRTGNLTITGDCVETDGACADYVFEPDYEYLSLEELETFIVENKHLPNVPSTAEIKKNGLNVQNFQGRLLEKVEELVLYTLDQQSTIDAQQGAIDAQQGTIDALAARLEALEVVSDGQ
jgi:hypothetical protein